MQLWMRQAVLILNKNKYTLDGLNFSFKVQFEDRAKVSPPTRGAWIEIDTALQTGREAESPPTRGAWIEIRTHLQADFCAVSPPTRGAWIEIVSDCP